jgi:hypothetical protein
MSHPFVQPPCPYNISSPIAVHHPFVQPPCPYSVVSHRQYLLFQAEGENHSSKRKARTSVATLLRPTINKDALVLPCSFNHHAFQSQDVSSYQADGLSRLIIPMAFMVASIVFHLTFNLCVSIMLYHTTNICSSKRKARTALLSEKREPPWLRS